MLESSTAPTISQDVLLESLHKAYPSAAIFTVVPGFSNAPCASNEVEQKIPELLTAFYDSRYSKMKEDELENVVKDIQLKVTEEEALFLEKATRSQSRTCLWYDHRIGRITASMFGRVYKCAETKYPTALVKSLMQYSHVNPTIPSLKWGHDNEDHAREKYKISMEPHHESFSVQSAGLLVSTKFPFLGASPDGVISCTCCGTGLLEIKCPYKYRNSDIKSITDSNFYLQLDQNHKWEVDKRHEYYCQIQGQMGIWDKPYCDFFCWTLKGSITVRVAYDHDFFEQMVVRLHHFFTKYLLPELMTQKLKFTMDADDDELENNDELAVVEDDELENEELAIDEPELYCYCRAAEMEGLPMIACDAPDCPIEWFHFSCVGITNEPDSDEEWYCDDCKSKLNK